MGPPQPPQPEPPPIDRPGEVLAVRDLGRIGYREAYALQESLVEAQVARRERPSHPRAGTLLLLEHPPVITVSRRPGAEKNILASPETLAREGVAVEPTDRGGDITYHGPGQLVAYPILDLNLLNLGLHEYVRLLEEAIIRTCADLGLLTLRDPAATGVWTRDPEDPGLPYAKVAAIGVRVRRWVSMHGLALNVATDLRHFQFIIPCGLVNRPVTSLAVELSRSPPEMPRVKSLLASHLTALVSEALASAQARRDARAPKEQGPERSGP